MDIAAAVHQDVAAQVGELRYNLWFRDNTKMQVDDEELVVGVPNLFFQEWLSSNFLPTLRRSVERVLGRRLRVRIVVDGELFRERRERAAPEAAAAAAAATPAAAMVLEPAAAATLRNAQTMNDYVVGASNRLAHAAAVQVIECVRARFNPLLIHGAVGLGKTHLLRGIEHGLRAKHRDAKVQYITAEKFTNDFLESLRGGNLNAFRQKLRRVDVLLLDNLHFLSSKKATWNELLHTFDALDIEHKQLVLVADRHPQQIDGFSDELGSRLVAGMVCPVEAPDFDTRVRILETKAQRAGLKLDRTLAESIAMRLRRNVRELEGAIHRLSAQCEVTGESIDSDVLHAALGELFRHRTPNVGMREIERAVCDVFQVDGQELRSPTRARSVSHPRMVAMYLSRKHTGAAYDAIGRHFGGRNHSTVMSAERKVAQWIKGETRVELNGRSWSLADAIQCVEQRLT